MSNQNSIQPVIEPVILAKDMPVTLPQADSIVELCKAAGYEHTGLVIRDESQGVPVAWVKYGNNVTMGEARTQAYVAGVVNANPDVKVRVAEVYLAFQHGRFGYIVMEYIPGRQCTSADAPQVAAVVKYLATIKGPTLVPGPVGGGPIGHSFFIDCESDIAYESVQHLEAHVNGVSLLFFPLCSADSVEIFLPSRVKPIASTSAMKPPSICTFAPATLTPPTS